ncbi:MAG: hypothetical protein KTR31_15480 [Myxococcales bacterium]|nr:hypothetical protein [Myxococcales bacterium]
MRPPNVVCIVVALLGSGCGATAIDVFETCDLDVVLEPAAASPGEQVTAYGGPYSEVRDTRLTVGGVDAVVVSVESRDDRGKKSVDLSEACDLCAACRLTAGCAPCGACTGVLLDASDRVECFGDTNVVPATEGACDLCVEQVVFEVPEVAPGEQLVWMVNEFGASSSLPFEVLGAPDTSDTASPTDPMTADTAP